MMGSLLRLKRESDSSFHHISTLLYGCVWSEYQRRSPDPRTPQSRRSPRAWERRDIPASRGSSWERDMFHGIRLLFCTFKEGTVIRGDIVAGEKTFCCWQAHAVRRAGALSDIIPEGMETGLPTLLSLEGPVAARENATRRYTRENTMESKH